MRKLSRATEKDTPPGTGDDTNVRPGPGTPPGTPRWVKVFGIIALALLLLFVIMHLTGRGFGGHTPSIKHGMQQQP